MTLSILELLAYGQHRGKNWGIIKAPHLQLCKPHLGRHLLQALIPVVCVRVIGIPPVAVRIVAEQVVAWTQSR